MKNSEEEMIARVSLPTPLKKTVDDLNESIANYYSMIKTLQRLSVAFEPNDTKKQQCIERIDLLRIRIRDAEKIIKLLRDHKEMEVDEVLKRQYMTDQDERLAKECIAIFTDDISILTNDDLEKIITAIRTNVIKNTDGLTRITLQEIMTETTRQLLVHCGPSDPYDDDLN